MKRSKFDEEQVASGPAGRTRDTDGRRLPAARRKRGDVLHLEARGSASPKDLLRLARHHLEESARVKRHAARANVDALVSAALLIADAMRQGSKLLICGNGGSAADSQHIAAEFVSTLRSENYRRPLAAIALTTDTSFLTANANDFGFDGIFERQIQALGRSGDVLLAISTSGNSRNVVMAVDAARAHAMKTVAFTGESGGTLEAMCDVTIRVPSCITQHVQECHIAFGHILCEIIEHVVFEPDAL